MKLSLETIIWYLILPFWSLTILGTLFVIKASATKAFDPESTLYELSQDVNFDTEFTNIISNHIQGHTQDLVVHFNKTTGCLCQLTSSQHISNVKNLVLTANKKNLDINLDESSLLAKIIPSVPSIAVFNTAGKLTYLGPYSSGIGCFSSDGSVEPFIKQNIYISASLNIDSNGCYCAT